MKNAHQKNTYFCRVVSTAYTISIISAIVIKHTQILQLDNLSVQFSSIKHIRTVVQPSHHPLSELSILQNYNSFPLNPISQFSLLLASGKRCSTFQLYGFDYSGHNHISGIT
jgi:hypothetical protein